MNRRGFLGAILAAATAPAIVRADSLMRVVSHETLVLTPYPQTILLDADAGGVVKWGELTPAQVRAWSAALWGAALDTSFAARVLNSGVIQRG